jgi:hypothetical protein
MKQMYTSAAAFALAVAFAPSANAGWNSGTVGIIQVDFNGYLNLFLSAVTECGGTQVSYMRPIIGSDDGKAILAAALAWQAQGNTVTVNITSCNGTIGVFNAVHN